MVSVNNGTITLSNIEAKTPYVIYKGEAAPAEDVNYGDGSFVKDPGFNYGDLREWTVVSGNPEVRKNDNEGDLQSTVSKYDGNLRNYELIIPDSQETEVTQTVTGLNGGEEYAASVMVEVEQGKERMASIKVDCGGETGRPSRWTAAGRLWRTTPRSPSWSSMTLMIPRQAPTC